MTIEDRVSIMLEQPGVSLEMLAALVCLGEDRIADLLDQREKLQEKLKKRETAKLYVPGA